MFYDYKHLLEAYNNIYCIVFGERSNGKINLVQSTGKNNSVHLSGKTEVRLKPKEQIKMSKKSKFRFTVTIEDSEVIYRNSYLNNVLNYTLDAVFKYPNKKVWIFDAKKSIFYKVINKSISEKGYPQFTFQIIK